MHRRVRNDCLMSMSMFMFTCLELWLFVDSSILLLSYSISSGALESPDLLLPYFMYNSISIVQHIASY